MERTMSEQQEVVYLIEKYGDLAKKLAWECWKGLPGPTKVWISPEDLISEAYLCFILNIQANYNPMKASACTFIWHSLKNMFVNFQKHHWVKKRNGVTLHIEDILEAGDEEESSEETFLWMGKDDANVAQREALNALALIYWSVTPECRLAMQRWFGQEKTIVLRSAKAKKVYDEFALMAGSTNLQPEECLELMRGGVCLP